MNTEYLSIKEFAEKAGVSQQSIYKRLRANTQPFKPYLKELNGKKYISAVALKTLYSVESQGEQQQTKNNVPDDGLNRLLSILENELNELRGQLQEKDNQLKEKDLQISNLTNLLEQQQTALLREQQLTAHTLAQLTGETSTGENDAAASPAVCVADPDSVGDNAPRKESFFSRIFRRTKE